MSILVERTSVHCEQDDHEFYRSIVSGKKHDGAEVPFPNMMNAFITFACMGFHHQRYEPLSQRREIFLAPYLDQNLHLPVFAALAYARRRQEDAETPTTEIMAGLMTTGAIVPLVEGWAKGGLAVFREQQQPGGGLTLDLFEQLDAIVPERPEPPLEHSV